MFELKENDFMNKGICKYKDENGNSIFMKRTGDMSFVAKLRFSDTRIKAAPFYVSLPFKDNEDGANLHLDYTSDVQIDSEEVQEVLSGYTKVVQRWIEMFIDIKHLEVRQVENVTETDLNNNKMASICQYDELKDMVSGILGNL